MPNDINDKITGMEESLREKQKSLDDLQSKFSEFMKPISVEKTNFGSVVVLANNVLMINCGSENEMKQIIQRLKK